MSAKMDFSAVRSHEAAKRAILVAMAGNHSVALIGPSGCGKSMLAECVAGHVPVYEVTTTGPGDVKANGRLGKLARVAAVHCEVASVPFREMVSKRAGTDTATIWARIEAAEKFRWARGGGNPLPHEMSDACKMLMKQAYDELGLNPRALTTVCAVARTIADLDGSKDVAEVHVAEAVQYRLFDRRF